MGLTLGANGKAYWDAISGHASPSWDLLSLVKSVTINAEVGDADVTDRSVGAWKAFLPTLKDVAVDVSMNYDTTDAGFAALKAAFLAGTILNMAFMDGPVATTGSQGLRAPMFISKFPRSEDLENYMTIDMTFKLAYYPAAGPEWLVVS